MVRPEQRVVKVGVRASFACGIACAALSCVGLLSCSSKAPPGAPALAEDRVFISQAGSNTLLVVDARSGDTAARIDIGMLPHNLVVSPDRRTLYAALVGSQAIAEIDVATLSLRRTLLTAPVPERRVDGSLIQPHFDQDAFSASSCYGCHRPAGAEPKYAGDRPFGLLLSGDGRRLYVTHLRASRLTVLDLDAGQIESTTSLAPAGTATELVAIDRMGDEIWVALRPPQPSSTTTDDKGTFSLEGLDAGDVTLAISVEGYAPAFASALVGDTTQLVLARMKKQGTPQPYAADTAKTLSEKTEAGPYAVIFEPNSLDTDDTKLKVSITPLDPTKERDALPGTLTAGGKTPSLLVPVTFAEFTILDSKVNASICERRRPRKSSCRSRHSFARTIRSARRSTATRTTLTPASGKISWKGPCSSRRWTEPVRCSPHRCAIFRDTAARRKVTTASTST